jgi:hypothetical protein
LVAIFRDERHAHFVVLGPSSQMFVVELPAALPSPLNTLAVFELGQ